jgi:hypothetical protein
VTYESGNCLGTQQDYGWTCNEDFSVCGPSGSVDWNCADLYNSGYGALQLGGETEGGQAYYALGAEIDAARSEWPVILDGVFQPGHADGRFVCLPTLQDGVGFPQVLTSDSFYESCTDFLFSTIGGPTQTGIDGTAINAPDPGSTGNSTGAGSFWPHDSFPLAAPVQAGNAPLIAPYGFFNVSIHSGSGFDANTLQTIRLGVTGVSPDKRRPLDTNKDGYIDLLVDGQYLAAGLNAASTRLPIWADGLSGAPAIKVTPFTVNSLLKVIVTYLSTNHAPHFYCPPGTEVCNYAADDAECRLFTKMGNSTPSSALVDRFWSKGAYVNQRHLSNCYTRPGGDTSHCYIPIPVKATYEQVCRWSINGKKAYSLNAIGPSDYQNSAGPILNPPNDKMNSINIKINGDIVTIANGSSAILSER